MVDLTIKVLVGLLALLVYQQLLARGRLRFCYLATRGYICIGRRVLSWYVVPDSRGSNYLLEVR
jgi:hypothetical protein